MTGNKKKGQVSLEFLTTYGWAFLIALVVLGGLAYFGVLNPGNFTGKKCLLTQQIKCPDFQMGMDAATKQPIMKLRLQNMLPSRIVITQVNFTNGEAVPLGGCSITSPSPFPPAGEDGVTIMEGKGVDFTARCAANTGNFFIGDKNKVKFNVVYYIAKSGPAYNTTISGDMFDEVVEI